MDGARNLDSAWSPDYTAGFRTLPAIGAEGFDRRRGERDTPFRILSFCIIWLAPLHGAYCHQLSLDTTAGSAPLSANLAFVPALPHSMTRSLSANGTRRGKPPIV